MRNNEPWRALLAEWKEESDSGKRMQRLRDVSSTADTTACEEAWRIFTHEVPSHHGWYAELGWLIRALNCVNHDPQLLSAISERAVKVTEDEAILALAEIACSAGDPEALPVLDTIASRSDLDGHVRGFAIERIGLLGHRSERSLKIVRSGLVDFDPHLRFWSCYALAAIGARSDLARVESLFGDDATVDGFGTVADEARLAWNAIINNATED